MDKRNISLKDDMTGLILKLSYNNIGETPVTGGICGSSFFVKQDMAITANHVLNKNSFRPNDGFRYCQLWLLLQPDTIIELKLEELTEYPAIDTTIIRLGKTFAIPIRKISSNTIDKGLPCFNEGFIAHKMPELRASWGQDKLIITGCMFQDVIANSNGYIKSLKIFDVQALDIKMNGVKGFKLSYGGVLGMSGGPLINKDNDEIIGLMSIGMPENAFKKEILYAVAIEEVLARMNMTSHI